MTDPIPSPRSPDRWTLEPNKSIVWRPTDEAPHVDHVEMSGRQVSVIVRYGVDAVRRPVWHRTVVFPLLRFHPNLTHDHYKVDFGPDVAPEFFIDGQRATEAVLRFVQRGVLEMESQLGDGGEVFLTRTIFPSLNQPLVVERYRVTNRSGREITLGVRSVRQSQRTEPEKGVYGGYAAEARFEGPAEWTLAPGGTAEYALQITGVKTGSAPLAVDAAAEQVARERRVAEILRPLRLETPDPVIDAMFAFAKLRAVESIFETKSGLLHSPGGEVYYAAIWANDQAEYANPFFAFLGDPAATESALNAFRLFGGYMNPEYRAIPSSIISEGAGFWNGAGDRGDMAMIAYGAGRFALAYGSLEVARQLWPLIEWCLEYCRRKVTRDGIVASDADELENRFPAGDANLSTACLYYDALRSATLLARDLGLPEAGSLRYEAQGAAVRVAIETFFGARVEGFDTYRYYDGNTTLRAWICAPLTVEIFDRRRGTVAALFSPRLWTEDGLATEAGKNTFWDRATLYALRGVFAAGETQRAMDYLGYYSRRRLLGEHVPFAVEAYPEGNQRQLSAESALYGRVITEGLWGIRPTGLRTFACTPRLPEGWPGMTLANIFAFGSVFSLTATREGGSIAIDCRKADGSGQSYRTDVGRQTVLITP